MESRLRLEPADQVFDTGYLFERAVEKDHVAILVPDVAYNAIDPVRIRMKIVETQLVPDDKKDYNANADANGQPEDMDQRIPPLPEDIASGYLHRDGIDRHWKTVVKAYLLIPCQTYKYPDGQGDTWVSAGWLVRIRYNVCMIVPRPKRPAFAYFSLNYDMRNQYSRREFLFLSSSATLAAALPATLPAAVCGAVRAAVNAGSLPKMAVQLYTIRDQIAKDMSGSLQKLASLGVRTVETAFWPKNVTVKQAAQVLKAAGLKACSSHIEIPVGDKKAAMLETAEAFDCKRMIWHGWPEDKRYSSLEGTRQLIDIYNEAGAWAKANGLQFGLHNHWWEYRNKVGGRWVYEWLLEGVSKDVFFELDTYWIKVAGHDPAAIISKFGDRARFLHMKDGPAVYNDALIKDKPDPMTPLGRGAQNIPAIAKAAKPNIEWMVIEMDVVAMDVYQAIKDSRDYLVKNKFAAA